LRSKKIGEFTKFIFSQAGMRIVAFATPFFYCICYTTHRDEVSCADKDTRYISMILLPFQTRE